MNFLINAILVLVFIRVMLSWFPTGLGGFSSFVYDVTEPILKPIRRLIPPVGGALDLSPIIVFIILQIIQSLINR